MTRRFLSLASVLICSIGSGSLHAQDLPATNPFAGDPDAIRIGMGVYRIRCADCHGVDGRGVRGPDLTQIWDAGRTDAGLFRTITEGVPGTAMRPIDRVRTRDSEIWQLIAYLGSIARPSVAEARGDPGRGAELFQGYCSVCHQVSAAGGRVGPDLSRIGSARSVEALVRRIRGDFGKQVGPGFAPVALTTARGEPVQGVARNQDLLSIQVMDMGGRIQGFLKDDLRALETPGGSVMPAYSPEVLSDAVLDDLVSYLQTLRGYDPGVR